MLVLISPAKKLDATVEREDLAYTQPDFLKATERLVKTARKLSKADLSSLMGISEKLAELNHARFKAFKTPFSLANAKHAVLMFNGDTYQGLDADSLSDKDLAYAQDHLRILSGLYGLLRPLDLIQPYRLEMGSKLKNPSGEDLYDFWGASLTDAINETIARDKKPVVVNLASTEYSSAVHAKNINGQFITPVFKEVKNGQAKVIGLMAKRARGMMARYIIQNRIEAPEKLKDFKDDGYKFQAKLSTETRLEFHRKA